MKTAATLQLRILIRLTRRFARSLGFARSAGTVFVSALFVTAMFVVLGSFSLSGSQVADRDLGRFNALSSSGGVRLPPGEGPFVPDLYSRMREAGIDDVLVTLTALDVQLTTPPFDNITLLEAAWESEPYPGRYRLLTGRWPAQPGEVVVTDPGDQVEADVGEDLRVLGGEVKLQVVGIADDRYASTANLLAATGTWAGLDADLAEGFPALGAQPFVRWNASDPDTAIAAIAAAAQRWAREHGGEPMESTAEAISDSVITRDELMRESEKSWIAHSPAGYTVPSILLPVVSVLLVFGLNDRRFRSRIASMVSVGVPRGTAAMALTAAALFWCLVAAVLGMLMGIAAGAGGRAGVAVFRDRPPGPIDGLLSPALRLLGVVVVTGVLAGAMLAYARRESTPKPLHGSMHQPSSAVARFARDARQLLALGGWCASAVYGTRVDSPAEAMIFAGIVSAAVLLLAPEAVRVMLRLLPERTTRQRLAARQLAADQVRTGAALAVLTLLLGAALGYLALLDTFIRIADGQSYPDVAAGQALLVDRAAVTQPPPGAVVEAAEASGHLAGGSRTEITYLLTGDDFAPVRATRAGHDPSLLAVSDTAQVERLIGHPLSEKQTAVLTNGGLLVWADAEDAPAGDSARTSLEVRDGDTIVHQTSELPAAAVDLPLAGWRDGTDGILLRATALDLSLPVRDTGPIMITGITDDAARALAEAVSRAGFDAGTVQIYTQPPPAVPPIALLATAFGLVLLTLAATLSAVRGQTRVLRGYLAQLLTIGISASWARRVLLYQLGALIAASTLLGLVIAVIPTAVLAYRISSSALSIPWSQMFILLGTIYCAAALAAVHSIARLRAAEGMGASP